MTQGSTPQQRPFRVSDKVLIIRPEPRRAGEIRHIDPATGEIYVLPDNENAYVKVLPQDLELRRPRPRRLSDKFEVGEIVRITEGPFADFEGVVEAVFPEQERLRVVAMVFGRATPTDVSFSQVQKK